MPRRDGQLPIYLPGWEEPWAGYGCRCPFPRPPGPPHHPHGMQQDSALWGSGLVASSVQEVSSRTGQPTNVAPGGEGRRRGLSLPSHPPPWCSPHPCAVSVRGGAAQSAEVGSWRVSSGSSSALSPQASPQARRLSCGWKGQRWEHPSPFAPGPLPCSLSWDCAFIPQLARLRPDAQAPQICALPAPDFARPRPSDTLFYAIPRLPDHSHGSDPV